MGRRRSFWSKKFDRALYKIDPSGCLSGVLFGIIMLIIGLCLLRVSTILTIIFAVIAAIFIIWGIVLGVRYYRNNEPTDDDTDYTEF